MCIARPSSITCAIAWPVASRNMTRRRLTVRSGFTRYRSPCTRQEPASRERYKVYYATGRETRFIYGVAAHTTHSTTPGVGLRRAAARLPRTANLFDGCPLLALQAHKFMLGLPVGELVLRAAVHKAAAAVAQRELSISLGTECALFQLVLLKEPGRHVRVGSHRLHFFSDILLNGWVRRGCFLELGKFGHVKVVAIVCQGLLTGIIWDLRIPRGRCVRHQEKEQMLTIV
jgi:hypothetical protein